MTLEEITKRIVALRDELREPILKARELGAEELGDDLMRIHHALTRAAVIAHNPEHYRK